MQRGIFIYAMIFVTAVSHRGRYRRNIWKGRIIGGTVTALKYIKANETGSPAGVKTNIIIGVNAEQAERKEKIMQPP
jgi:uncharacterized protein (DUF342 family)